MFWNVHNHLITMEMTKKAFERADSITGQWSAALLPAAQAQEIKGSAQIVIPPRIHGQEQMKVTLSCRGYHHALIHSNHTQNLLWGFPHCRARRFFSDLWGPLCFLMYWVWRATGATPVKENELLWFPQLPSSLCKIQGTCLDVTKPH